MFWSNRLIRSMAVLVAMGQGACGGAKAPQDTDTGVADADADSDADADADSDAVTGDTGAPDPGDLDGDLDGHTPNGGDCDDADDTVFPGAAERCDGQVNACGAPVPADEVDADGDGHVACTIDAGGWDGDPTLLGGEDCDDADPSVFPGAVELCDGIDRDCDGSATAAPEDAYEVPGNDTRATATWLGEIDDEIAGFEVVTLAGLTLHDELDEDWFSWDADDDWYDNVAITVSVTLPSTGTYEVALYLDVGGMLVLKDAVSGNGAVTVSSVGDSNVFVEDEDTWFIQVYASPAGWDPVNCSETYEIEIQS